MPGSGKTKNVNNTQFIVFCHSYTTPSESKTIVRKKRKTRREGTTALNFWRLSLSVLYGLVKAMFARDTSRGAGSEARGEGGDRGYFD